MARIFSAGLALVITFAAAGAALAQTAERPGPTIAFTGGATTVSSDTRAAVGGALLFDLNDWLALEGQGVYLDRGPGADGFTLNASLLVNLLPLGNKAIPYAAIGGGLYHASFDMDNGRFLGPVGAAFGPGMQICPATGTGFGFGAGPGMGSGTACTGAPLGFQGVGDMPGFYARRLGVLTIQDGMMWGTRSFTDPMLSLGGGLRLDLTEHLMLRPDVRALLVFGNGDSHTVGMFTLNLGYRF